MLRGLDPRDLDREVVRKHRAVGAIEPIEGDAIFVTDLLGCVDGERSRSGFVLAYWLCRRASCRPGARIVRRWPPHIAAFASAMPRSKLTTKVFTQRLCVAADGLGDVLLRRAASCIRSHLSAHRIGREECFSCHVIILKYLIEKRFI